MVIVMPKKVDHEERRRQITDAVCRITLRDGLNAATFRKVAAEAGISVPLVQHYFSSKADLLETTQRHVGERSTARLMEWICRTDGSAREVLGAFLKSFIPIDEESRTAGLMYIALYHEAVVSTDPDDGTSGHRTVEADLMVTTILEQLDRGPLSEGVVPELEAHLLSSLTTGVGQYVFLGTITPEQAYETIDYHLDGVFRLEVEERVESEDAP